MDTCGCTILPDEEAMASRREISTLRTSLESIIKLLGDRPRELKVAQPFLTKVLSLART